jgi:hypothetical protein
MKLLTSRKVERGNGSDPTKTLKEWESAKDQATVEGMAAFLQRQRDRMAAAQANAEEAAIKVRQMARKAIK